MSKKIIDKTIPFDRYHVYIVGVGGTGARVVRDFSGFAYSLQETGLKQINLTLHDNDIVTANNIYRQPFCPNDVGRLKSEVLAERYSSSYDMNITYHTTRIESAEVLYDLLFQYHGYTPILIGCVDNVKARKLFHEVFDKASSPLIWIDAGNEQISGQVILGVKGNKGTVVLPSVTQRFPEILEMDDPEEVQSCSNVPISDVRRMSQYLATNMQAATIVVTYLTLIMLGMDINTHTSNFDISNVNVQSEFIDYSRFVK